MWIFGRRFDGVSRRRGKKRARMHMGQEKKAWCWCCMKVVKDYLALNGVDMCFACHSGSHPKNEVADQTYKTVMVCSDCNYQSIVWRGREKVQIAVDDVYSYACQSCRTIGTYTVHIVPSEHARKLLPAELKTAEEIRKEKEAEITSPGKVKTGVGFNVVSLTKKKEEEEAGLPLPIEGLREEDLEDKESPVPAKA